MEHQIEAAKSSEPRKGKVASLAPMFSLAGTNDGQWVGDSLLRLAGEKARLTPEQVIRRLRVAEQMLSEGETSAKENAQLKRSVADKELEVLAYKKISAGKF